MALSKQQVEHVRPCKFAVIYQGYDKADRAQLEQWAHDQVPARRIINAMAADNEANRTTPATLLTHFRAQCGCPPNSPLKGVWRAPR